MDLEALLKNVRLGGLSLASQLGKVILTSRSRIAMAALVLFYRKHLVFELESRQIVSWALYVRIDVAG